jgi:ABC-type sugar transport system substrate-binding protein
VLHNRQSCERAAAAVVAHASSNGNSPSSQTQQQQISIIASDVDGTLLNAQQQLTPGVEAAVKQAAEAGVPVSMLAELGSAGECHFVNATAIRTLVTLLCSQNPAAREAEQASNPGVQRDRSST